MKFRSTPKGFGYRYFTYSGDSVFKRVILFKKNRWIKNYFNKPGISCPSHWIIEEMTSQYSSFNEISWQEAREIIPNIPI